MGVMIYLDDVRGNLELLYGYSQAVGSLRAFGMADEKIVEFLAGHFSANYGKKLTVDGVVELGLFELVDCLQRAIERNDESAINRVHAGKYFSAKVQIILYALSKIESEEREDAAAKAAKNMISTRAARNASKPRRKDKDGNLLIEFAKEMLKNWNEKPESYKNISQFKKCIVEKTNCSMPTASSWFDKFLTDGLVSDEVIKILPTKLASKATSSTNSAAIF